MTDTSPLITEVPHAIHEPLTPRRPKHSSTSDYSSEQLLRMFERLRDGRIVPAERERAPLREWMSHEMLKAVSTRDYEYGERLKEADALIAAQIKADEISRLNKERRKKRDERIEAAEKRLTDADNECRSRIEEWNQSHATRAETLVRSQEQALRDLEQRWSESDTLTPFKKPSARLLVLRTTERRLAVMRLFDRAKRVRAEAEIVEQQEKVAAERRAIAAMRTRYENFAEANRRRNECFEEWAARHREANEKTMAEKVGPINLALKRLSTCGPVLRERSKVKIWGTDTLPESPRQMSNAVEAREAQPGQPLPLSGIKLREHVKIKKVDLQSSRPKKRRKGSPECQ
jgi:hypothetical protein